MHRVFVSSTFQDLEEHRRVAVDAIRRLGAVDVAMEHFGARDNRPKDECLRLIREESDLFVCVCAHRYGFIPEGDDVSIVESEYREALRSRLPIFAYLIDEVHPWAPTLRDEGEPARKLAALKAELRRDRMIGTFTTPDRLAAVIAADLGRHLAQQADRGPEVHGIVHEPAADWISPVQRNPWRYKVVAFDLDGTLLRGAAFDFSWEAIWRSLGFGRGIQNELRREYRQHSGPEASRAARITAYQEWCARACEHFKSRGLSRDRLREFARSLTLTNHCREALDRLRSEGMVTAIISGGVDTFLEDTFPDFRDHLDFVFINRLLFAENGTLQSVLATAYDFQGKAEALDLICKRAGCTPAETVFVGDHFNDEAIMLKAAKAIAYPPQDVVIVGASQVSIMEDDLLAIVPHILVE